MARNEVRKKLGEGDTLYLSGPMSGLPNYNYPTFEAAAGHFRSQGLEVYSPHEVEGSGEDVASGNVKPWAYYMTKALIMQLKCDAWVGLPGWTQSKGAKREFDLAVDLGHKLFLAKRIHFSNDAFWKLEELS